MYMKLRTRILYIKAPILQVLDEIKSLLEGSYVIAVYLEFTIVCKARCTL